MNLYILVEGSRTEMKVYPRWLSILKPLYERVPSLDLLTHNSYYIFSGLGYPSILEHVKKAVYQIAVHNESHEKKVDQFVICLDADCVGCVDETSRRVEEQIARAIVAYGIEFDVPYKIIVQNKCFETWFLGNRAMYPDDISDDFEGYHRFYNVSKNDPEEMTTMGDKSVGEYHLSYLKKMLASKGFRYSKTNAQCVCSADYIEKLQCRVEDTTHLQTLKDFFEFVESL